MEALLYVSSVTMGTQKHDAYEKLRRFVIERREAIGLTQREVALRGGFSPGILAKLEAGSIPSIPKQETLAKLAKGLGVTYETLDHLARGIPIEQGGTSTAPSSKTSVSPRISEALRRFDALPPEVQDELLEDWEALLSRREHRSAPSPRPSKR